MNPAEEFSHLQNPSEPFSNVQQHSEDFSSFHSASQRTVGIGRGKKYPGADIPDDTFVGDDYIVMEDAYAMFDSEGERRSVRMIAEYCKTGELVCSYDSDDKRWHITQESVENKIKKIKALNARKVARPPQSTSEHFSERPAAPQSTPEAVQPKSDAAYPPADDMKKLEREILDLKILNRGKDYFIEQLQKEREDFITRIETSSHLIGQLETKLLQLEAPRQPTPGNDTFSSSPVRITVRSESNVFPNEPLSDNTDDNYEHSPQEPFAEDQR